MNYSIIAYILGWVTFLEGAFMLLPLLTAVIYAEKSGLVFVPAPGGGICLRRFDRQGGAWLFF